MKCYGKFQKDHADCKICQYAESCRYYTLTAHSVESRSGFPSYEAMQKFLPDQCDDSNTPGESDESTQNELYSMLSSFFRYLVDLDEYTLGIIAEIVSPSEPGVHCTVSYLAKQHGCSRWAMHKKLLRTLSNYPELSTLLNNTLYKLTNSRKLFLRQRAREKAVAK